MAPRDDEDPKKQLFQGLGLLWKAARGAATEVQKELDKSNVGKAIDDAGRELGRAVENVVTRIGAEIKKVQPKEPDYVDREGVGKPPDGTPDRPAEAAAPDAWPTTRHDYEKRYGPVVGEWPRSLDEYEKRFGHRPGNKPKGPTPDDPGFSIASSDAKPGGRDDEPR